MRVASFQASESDTEGGGDGNHSAGSFISNANCLKSKIWKELVFYLLLFTAVSGDSQNLRCGKRRKNIKMKQTSAIV